MPIPPLQKTIYTGTFISTPSLGSLRVLENHAVGVDENGVIKFICKIGTEKDGVNQWMNIEGWKGEEVRWVEGGIGGEVGGSLGLLVSWGGFFLSLVFVWIGFSVLRGG